MPCHVSTVQTITCAVGSVAATWRPVHLPAVRHLRASHTSWRSTETNCRGRCALACGHTRAGGFDMQGACVLTRFDCHSATPCTGPRGGPLRTLRMLLLMLLSLPRLLSHCCCCCCRNNAVAICASILINFLPRSHQAISVHSPTPLLTPIPPFPFLPPSLNPSIAPPGPPRPDLAPSF